MRQAPAGRQRDAQSLDFTAMRLLHSQTAEASAETALCGRCAPGPTEKLESHINARTRVSV